MSSYEDQEYEKGFKRGLSGKRRAEAVWETLNVFGDMFRTNGQSEARQRGFEAGKQEALDRRTSFYWKGSDRAATK